MLPNKIPQTSPMNWLLMSILLMSFILMSNSKQPYHTLNSKQNTTTKKPMKW